MKRLICVVFATITLVGCAERHSAVTPILKGITFNAEINCYNECYSACCNITEDGIISAEFTAPEELAGYKVTATKDELKTEYKGMTVTEKTKKLPLNGAYTAMADVLQDVIGGENTVINNGNELYLKGDTGNNKYRLSIGSTGLPVCLEISNGDFRIEFFDVCYNCNTNQ